MCEIAVLDPEQAGIEIAQQLAGTFHDEQGDGIGIVMVKDRGDRFEYETYKSTTPHWASVYQFMRRHYSDAWRVVIHGRNATSGNVNRQTAHPIHVDCECTEFDFVVHNGSVRNHENIRAGLIRNDHDFNTKVDTEIIAHKVTTIPDDVDELDSDTYSMRGNLNYLLFSENGIFVHVSNKYHLSDSFTMTCRSQHNGLVGDFGFERGNRTEWAIINPGDADERMETKERTYTSAITSRQTQYGMGSRNGVRRNYGTNSRSRYAADTQQQQADGTRNDDVVISYTDWMDDFDFISAIKVAPGVMRITNQRENETEFIFRDNNPRLYYYYAPEQEPDNIDQLEEYAEQDEDQSKLDDFAENAGDPDDFIEDITRDSYAQHIAEAENISMEDAAEISGNVQEMIEQDREVTEGAA